MSKRGSLEFLNDVHEAIKRIETYVEKIDYEKFLLDIKTQDAVVRNLEIIGEAAKNISDELKNKYSLVPWGDLAKVRDKLIHHYFGVNYDIVWDIIKEEFPKIVLLVEEILNKETE
ncbi:MAG: DUF86 domain-containing protein [Elusimicrobiota bacterium]